MVVVVCCCLLLLLFVDCSCLFVVCLLFVCCLFVACWLLLVVCWLVVGWLLVACWLFGCLFVWLVVWLLFVVNVVIAVVVVVVVAVVVGGGRVSLLLHLLIAQAQLRLGGVYRNEERNKERPSSRKQHQASGNSRLLAGELMLEICGSVGGFFSPAAFCRTKPRIYQSSTTPHEDRTGVASFSICHIKIYIYIYTCLQSFSGSKNGS